MSQPLSPEQPLSATAQCHELSTERNWEQTLDVLNKAMMPWWFYVGIVSNTEGKLLNAPVAGKYFFSRGKPGVPAELKYYFQNQTSLKELARRLHEESDEQGPKDVWYISGGWKDFPRGTCLINITQEYKPMLGRSGVREAFVILDGASKREHQGKAMYLVNKVLTNVTYAQQLHAEQKDEAAGKKAPQAKAQAHTGQQLVHFLKHDFKSYIPRMSMEEKAVFDHYLKDLASKNQLTDSLKQLQRQVNEYFNIEP